MVRAGIGRFWHDTSGMSLVEGVLVLPLMILVSAVMIEFGAAVHQYNQAVQAVHLGARLAAVSDPLVDLSDLESDSNAIEGIATPTDARSVSCGAGEAIACDVAGLERLINGSPAVIGMARVSSLIQPENVKVTYFRSGLGYVGRPAGPVVTVVVELVDVTFDLFLLGRLLRLNNIPIPTSAVAFTSEDLSTSCVGCSA